MNNKEKELISQLEEDFRKVYKYAKGNKDIKLPAMGMPFYKNLSNNNPVMFNKLGIEVVPTGRNDIFILRFFNTYSLNFGTGARLYCEKTPEGLETWNEYNKVLNKIKKHASLFIKEEKTLLNSGTYLFEDGEPKKIKFKEVFKSPSKKDERESEQDPIRSMIAEGEGPNIEFKASLRWDIDKKCVNPELEFMVAKEIAGFLNSEGGYILIGISDDRKILGLKHDYKTLGKKKDRDEFQLKLVQVVNNHIGAGNAAFWKIKFPIIENLEICMIIIEKSPEPVFLKRKGKKQEDFFIRQGSSTNPLTMSEFHKYISNRFKRLNSSTYEIQRKLFREIKEFMEVLFSKEYFNFNRETIDKIKVGTSFISLKESELLDYFGITLDKDIVQHKTISFLKTKIKLTYYLSTARILTVVIDGNRYEYREYSEEVKNLLNEILLLLENHMKEYNKRGNDNFN